MTTARKGTTTVAKATRATGVVERSDESAIATVTDRVRQLTLADDRDAAVIDGVMREVGVMYREGDRMAEVGGMVRTYAAANMVRLADNYPGKDYTSAEIAAMLPKADGTLNGASSVSGWRAMARLIFSKGFDVTSPELRLLARGAKDEQHVKAEIDKDGSTAESITRVLRTYVTDKGVKLQPTQLAELEAAKAAGKPEAEVEAMRQAMPQLRKSRTGAADTAAADKSEVKAEPEKSEGAPILPRNNTTTVEAILATVVRLSDLVANLSTSVESGNRDKLADVPASLDALSEMIAERIAASFAAEAEAAKVAAK